MATLFKQTFEQPNIINSYSSEITEEQREEFQQYLENQDQDIPNWVDDLSFIFVKTQVLENNLETYGKVSYYIIEG